MSDDLPRCPDHPMLVISGSCERCGRFFCEACDPLNGKHCNLCRILTEREAVTMPWKARQKRAAIALGLSFVATVVSSIWTQLQPFSDNPLLGLSLGMSLGLVAAFWSSLAWIHASDVPLRDSRRALSIPITGGGCLLAVVALFLICRFGVSSWD